MVEEKARPMAPDPNLEHRLRLLADALARMSEELLDEVERIRKEVDPR